MENAANLCHIKFVPEAFADRMYAEDASLIPRDEPSALIVDPGQAARQVIKMLLQGLVTTRSGKEISINAGTICIHGDNIEAVQLASEIRNSLRNNKIVIRQPEC